jgi:hypothetical protein
MSQSNIMSENCKANFEHANSLALSKECCKAILEQGINKGKNCERQKLANGYCGKHQTQAELEKAISEGKRKCSKNRCINTFEAKTTKQIEYCETCQKEKEENLKNSILCKSENCKSKHQESGYCGKHEPRALLLQEAEKERIRICDDGKRACKNPTFAGKQKCEDCLEKTREKEKGTYQKRKENGECTMCGIKIENTIKGIRGHEVQKCKKCYDITREVEDKRTRDTNYKVQNKLYPQSHYRQFLDTAQERNLYVDEKLTLEYFIELVNKPCSYCQRYNEHETVGIDRINSNKSYVLSNIVPCCEDCNRAKGVMDVNDFENFILNLAEKIKEKRSNVVLEDEESESVDVGKSYIRPHKIGELYVRGKLEEYIKLAEEDNRSPTFIEKLKEISALNTKLNGVEFKKKIISSLRSENNAKRLTQEGKRQKIPKKELLRIFENSNVKDAMTLYTKTFGEDSQVNQDIEWLISQWKSYDESQKNIEFNKFLVKCQNRRARNK